MLQKQLDILLRTKTAAEIRTLITMSDRKWFSYFARHKDMLKRVWKLCSPETLMKWYHRFLKNRWCYPRHSSGRRPVTAAIRKLVLDIKRANPSFGALRIKGELAKLDISLSRTSIQRILQQGRRDGTIVPTGSWARFLRTHGASLFACDFLTVDTVLGRRYFVFFIIHIFSRKIAHWGLTEHTTQPFMRQQVLQFSEGQSEPAHIIHDHGPELLHFPWEQYGIVSHPTSVCSPNLNAYAERFVGTLRRECLDHFIIFGRKQLRLILRKYVEYYQDRRPHQGRGNIPPSGCPPDTQGTIRRRPVLNDLITDFYRSA